MRRSGYTSIAVGLALESLSRKAMIEYVEEGLENEYYTVCRLTPRGVDWLLVNQGRFRMRKDEDVEVIEEKPASPISDEDIPF